MTNHEAQRQPQEIQADIQRTRTELDATLGALERRLSPGELVDRSIDYLRDSGARQYVDNLGTSVKEEPIPLALVGIGLAWLMLSGRRSRAPATTTEHALDDTTGRVKEKWSATTHKVSQTAHAARERADQLGESARQGVHRLRGGYDLLVNEQPLALGAIGLAIGAVLAASAPHTEAEDRLMDAQRNRPEPDDAKIDEGESVQAAMAGQDPSHGGLDRQSSERKSQVTPYPPYAASPAVR